jgi:hypothetical protein
MEHENDFQKPAIIPAVELTERPKKKGYSCLSWMVFGVFLFVMAVIFIPSFVSPPHAVGPLNACRSNLKNLGIGMEMYGTDWAGKYPMSLALLTPNYLRTIPECPAARIVTYQLKTGKVAYNETGHEDYYFLQCAGENHVAVSVPANYPQFDSIKGLMER